MRKINDIIINSFVYEKESQSKINNSRTQSIVFLFEAPVSNLFYTAVPLTNILNNTGPNQVSKYITCSIL